MADKHYGPQTLALHAGHTPDPTGSRAVPIHMTTAYLFNDTEHAANLFALKEAGYIYTRLNNPTTDVLEKRLAALHGAAGAVAVASGMAAIFYAVTTITSAGQNIVTGSNLYGGTQTLFEHTLKRFGIEARFVDSSDPANFEAAIDGNTRLVYSEAIGNPRCNVDDLLGIAKVAHDHGLPFILDATVAPPPVFNPFDFGCDIAVYSLTKLVGGHGTAMGGAIVEQGGFDWAAGGRCPELTAPDPTYNGVNLWEALGGPSGAACPVFTTKVRIGMLRDTGAAISPLNSFQIIQGMETLPLRARTHCENARKVAEFLDTHYAVEWVNYAGLPSHPDFDRAKNTFPLGPGAVFGFGVKGGMEAGRKFIENVELCSHLANILDAKTLVIHPASTTHGQSTPEEQQAAGVPADLIRISVGLEDADDIIEDLDRALAISQR
ncbi:MAG: O-acetylhomoserine aminocarboxypropyltransferase/cysteine synthase family protein [Pseudodesulfovibrio sp.]|jgi:O-acetylhomoserine (thiol)-lyase|uniref:O-acetylhomoserine aminocarboxypropyltransferase n=1 Tax=Pseudodesulfovibrio indicus TaxID=1716143 RepID=A0A126QPJ0_9BACT|nr:O-acetylhomoserine aminocarboxypropyltransferase/cysteine synthase family protein [Pseudodesulfovibrio indicus]AMK11912.1 O-acetylhomoserine aminocarboxypropyltransferase [Pseudodesulfovibrio indicus]TDT87178.1 O-acetylhomoserine sulfhydrylase [Pseudodesulfovibrio indicus]